jgi:3-oxoacyl-[acyl-carrier-protein] synthase II
MTEPAGVVVTGIGAVTAYGAGTGVLWRGVRDGVVAIRPVKKLPMDGYRTTYGGEVPASALPVRDRIGRPPGGGPDRGPREPALDFAIAAAEEAMAGCGLFSVPAERWGLVYGSCNGGLVSGERALREEAAGGEPDWRLSLLVPPQGIAEALSGAFGLRGPVLSVNTACASGAHAIAHAVEILRAGRADAMLVGGSDALSDVVFAGFNSLESLAAGPAAPYSRDRDGLSLGEGAGMLVLTAAGTARSAGATVLAEVLGYGLSADGYHPTAPRPDGAGAARAIRRALAVAGVQPDEVDYVNGHGTGTAKNDPAEVNAVRAALAGAADGILLSSTKSMIGHLLGAAGAVEAIVTVLALREQIAPPTAGYREPDPRCNLDVVPNIARPATLDVAASNNFAFAGANACVLLGRPGRSPRPRPGGPPAGACAGPEGRAGCARVPVGKGHTGPPGRPHAEVAAVAGRWAAGLPGDAVADPEPVVVTGLAALSPAGEGADALARAYRAGRVLGSPSTGTGGLRVAAVGVDMDRYVPARQRRRMDRLGLLAVAACQDALADAGLGSAERPAPRIGVVLGTGLGPMQSMEAFTRPLIECGPAMANPSVFPNTVYNAAAGQVAMLLGLTGVTSTVTATHAAGGAALCTARDLLRSGAADAVVCPAVDVLCPAVLGAYGRIPLFRGPDAAGYTLAEGGYAVVVERLSSARSRGATIHAELVGQGIASDARGTGRWDPRGGGLERAIRAALAEAALPPGGVSAVWLNAAGLPAVDRPERAALGRVFGAAMPAAEEPKRVLGEPVGAGSHLSITLALTGWRRGTQPTATQRAGTQPTGTQRTGTQRTGTQRTGAAPPGPVLVNSSSLGGTHVALVLAPWKEHR